jgi:hypothetical protein
MHNKYRFYIRRYMFIKTRNVTLLHLVNKKIPLVKILHHLKTSICM